MDFQQLCRELMFQERQIIAVNRCTFLKKGTTTEERFIVYKLPYTTHCPFSLMCCPDNLTVQNPSISKSSSSFIIHYEVIQPLYPVFPHMK